MIRARARVVGRADPGAVTGWIELVGFRVTIRMGVMGLPVRASAVLLPASQLCPPAWIRVRVRVRVRMRVMVRVRVRKL